MTACPVCGETAPTNEYCLTRLAGAAKAGEPCSYSVEGQGRLRARLEAKSAEVLAEHDTITRLRDEKADLEARLEWATKEFSAAQAMADHNYALWIAEQTRAHADRARAQAAEARLKQAGEALKPFAEQAECWPDLTDADTLTTCDPIGDCAAIDFTAGDLRRARTVLAALQGETDEQA